MSEENAPESSIEHFPTTVVKVLADGTEVLSSYVDRGAGEKLPSEVEAPKTEEPEDEAPVEDEPEEEPEEEPVAEPEVPEELAAVNELASDEAPETTDESAKDGE